MPQYVNKSEENINTGKFSPSVNYSQIEPRKENYRVPYVAPYDDTDSVGNFANSYANSYKVFAGSDKKEKEDDKGLRNQLAMNFNTIAERQRQGRISVAEAENYYRKLSNDYIAAGADEKTVNDVLKRYSWGVTSNEEARQKKLMENEMSNRKAYIDSLRENNPAFRGKSYEYIEDILANANQSYDDAKRYQRMTAQMSPESSEYRVNHSMMMDSATKNADVRFKILVDQAMTAGQPINKEFINAAEVNVRRSLMDPQGLALDQDTAIAVAERALNNTPFTQMANDVDSAYKYSTETYKTIVDNIKAGAEYQLYKDPNVANLMTIGGEPMKQAIVDQVIINHKDALVSIASNVTNGVEIKKDNITPDIVHELPTLIKGYENALRVEGVSTDFSKGSLGARVLEVYNGAYSFDPVNYTQQDLDNISRNYEELERRGDIKLAEKAVDKGLKSDDPKIREQWEKTAEELNKAKGTKIAANMLSATRNVKPSPAMRISGTVAQERVHYDPATGKAYLVEPEGFIQTTGEVFNKLNMSSSEYQTAVNDLNKQLSVLDKDTRIATMKALGYKEGIEGASEVTPKSEESSFLQTMTAPMKTLYNRLTAEENNKVSLADPFTGLNIQSKDVSDIPEAERLLKEFEKNPEEAVKLYNNMRNVIASGEGKDFHRTAYRVAKNFLDRTGSATVKSSETLANASVVGDPEVETAHLSIWEDVEQSARADARAEKGLDEYDTGLGAAGEAAYTTWKKSLPKNLQNESDYDLRGFYKKYGEKAIEEGQHLTDEFKKPNHPTFSKESKYYKKGLWAGEWDDKGNFHIPYDTPKEILDKLFDYWENSDEEGDIVINVKEKYND